MPTLADQIAPKPQQPSGLGGWLASIGDEMAGAFARYGRRSGAQRDASLELLNQASAPGTDPIMGAGQKLLGLAGLITHPLAFFPTREEWDQRLQAAGNDGRMSRSIGGFLSDLPSLIDPQMAAGGAVLATAPLAAKMLNKADDVADVGTRIVKNGGRYEIFDGEKYVGSAGVVDEHSSPFISVVNLEKEFRGKGYAKKLYKHIEDDLGRPLVPSPLGLSPEATAFWKKRLAKLPPEQREKVLAESFNIGKSYGTKDEIINSFLSKLRD